MPISNLCISTNVKYEGGRGVVKEGRTIGVGLELLKDIRVFFLFYVTFLFCCFGLIPLIFG